MSERWRIEMATLEPLRSPLGLLKVLITVSANLVGSRWKMMIMMTRKQEKERGGKQGESERRQHQSSLLDRLQVFALSGCFRADSAPKTEVQTATESGDLKNGLYQLS